MFRLPTQGRGMKLVVLFYTMKAEYKDEDVLEGVEKEPDILNEEELGAWDTNDDDEVVPESVDELSPYEDSEEKLSRFSPEY